THGMAAFFIDAGAEISIAEGGRSVKNVALSDSLSRPYPFSLEREKGGLRKALTSTLFLVPYGRLPASVSPSRYFDRIAPLGRWGSSPFPFEKGEEGLFLPFPSRLSRKKTGKEGSEEKGG
uniref:hypothetical protein n=1 Tax=Cronobacter dublinensis TaxID=413497 RepID=UPI001F2A6B4A